MTEEPRGHVFPKWGPRGPFRVYSWPQATVTGLGVVGAAFLMVAGLTPPAIILIGALGGLALRDPTGLPVWHRVGLGLRYLAAGRKGRRWAGTPVRLVPPWLTGVEVSWFHLSHGVMGVAKDRGRYLAAMRISPTRDPWLQSRADRDIAADDWARAVTSIPAEHVDRLQVLTVTRQGGGEALADDAAAANGPGLEVLKDVAAHLAAHVRRTDTYLVVRLDHRASKDTVRRGGEEAVGRLLYSTLQQLGAQFPTEQLQAEILAPSEWTDLLEQILLTEGELPGGAEPDGLPTIADVDESWTTITVNGVHHRLLWMWQWPLRPMAAGFLAPVLTGGGNRVVSLVVAPSDPEAHQRSIDWAYRRAEAAVETARGGKHRKQAELEALDRQLRELNEGHVPVQAMVTVAVSGSEHDDIEDMTGHVRSNAVAGSCRLAPLGGQQARALGWVLPLCRGFDRGVDG